MDFPDAPGTEPRLHVAVEEPGDDPTFHVDGSMRIVEWSRAVEELTGIPADAAIGRPCWGILRGHDRDGKPVCRPRCAVARTVADGWEVLGRDLVAPFPSGRTQVTMSTVRRAGSDGDRVVHRLRDARSGTGQVRLTSRQAQIVRLLAEGFRVRDIAARLGLSEPTVRNHVHGVLVGLGVHSQLEAAARARALGLTGARAAAAAGTPPQREGWPGVASDAPSPPAAPSSSD